MLPDAAPLHNTFVVVLETVKPAAGWFIIAVVRLEQLLLSVTVTV